MYLIFYISKTFYTIILAGIYIHIPYCKKACSYCNFHFSTNRKDKSEVLKCINMELEMREAYLKNKSIDTIYFGGGTPSILNKSEINHILQTILNNYKVKETAEITLECNPDDLDEQTLIHLKESGINRLSIGVQSFDERDLKLMNRSHSAKQSENCLKLAKQIGFENITIDLIYGLPNQSLSDWENNLQKMFAFNTSHFSAYTLTIEDKTALKHLVEKKKVILPKEQIVLAQFKVLMQSAKTNGYVHYEISNFAKEGCFSKHNSSYWKSKNYLGIGPSAHSYNGKSRSWNISSNKKYIHNLIEGKGCFQQERLSKKTRYNEYVFTSIRTIWGVNTKTIKTQFGIKYQSYFLKEVQKWEQQKRIKKSKEIYTLTNSGKFISDSITADLFMI